MQTTLVRLELNADRIQYVRTVANGRIELVEIRQQDQANSLELKVALKNTDDITA